MGVYVACPVHDSIVEKPDRDEAMESIKSHVASMHEHNDPSPWVLVDTDDLNEMMDEARTALNPDSYRSLVQAVVREELTEKLES